MRFHVRCLYQLIVWVSVSPAHELGFVLRGYHHVFWFQADSRGFVFLGHYYLLLSVPSSLPEQAVSRGLGFVVGVSVSTLVPIDGRGFCFRPVLVNSQGLVVGPYFGILGFQYRPRC